jgi:Bacteriophage baseplate protein W
MMNDTSLQGFAFPFRIDPNSGRVAMTSGEDKLRQNVRMILATRIGERPMLRDFGTRLHGLVHEVNDAALARLLQDHARECLLLWEPRVLITEMSTEQAEGEVTLRLRYVHTAEPVQGETVITL